MDTPLVAYATFYRNSAKAFETAPIAINGNGGTDINAPPLQLSLSLSKLEQGEYGIQITVLDPNGRKVSFWRAPVMIVP